MYRVRVRSVPPVVLALRRFPNPRLTGIGAGLFAALTMFVLACVDRLLFDSSELVYGLLFLPVSALTALWVRPADLVTAPISVPIAFAVGVFPISGGSEGLGGQIMGLVTALAVHAGWLYGGTLIAGLIASVRKVRQMRARRRYVLAQGRGGAPPPSGRPGPPRLLPLPRSPYGPGRAGQAGRGRLPVVLSGPERVSPRPRRCHRRCRCRCPRHCRVPAPVPVSVPGAHDTAGCPRRCRCRVRAATGTRTRDAVRPVQLRSCALPAAAIAAPTMPALF